MKNLLIILCCSAFSALSCCAQNDTKKFAKRFTVKNHPVKAANNKYDGVFNLYKVQSVSNLKRSNPEDWMVEYSSKIKKMVILQSIPVPKKGVNHMVNDILEFCKENKYENAANVDDSGNSTKIFYKLNNDQVTGLITMGTVSLTEDTGSVEARCISGKFSLEDVSEIVSKLSRQFLIDMIQ